jgi:hypothetical protein
MSPASFTTTPKSMNEEFPAVTVVCVAMLLLY